MSNSKNYSDSKRIINKRRKIEKHLNKKIRGKYPQKNCPDAIEALNNLGKNRL